MADDVDPTINELLTMFPEFFKLADSSPSQASTSPPEASTAQTKTSKFEHGQSENPKLVIALKGSIHASNNGEDNVGESEWAIPDEFAEPEISDWYKGGRPDFSDGTPALDLHEFTSDYDFDTGSGSLSKSKGKEPEPRQAEMWKFEEGNSTNLDQDVLYSPSDVLHELPASSDKSSAKRSISPPLFDAVAQRLAILNYQKPGASSLRNEFHESSADNAQEASEYDGTVGNGFEYSGRLTANLAERPIANEHGLRPPIVVLNENPQSPRFVLRAPPPSAFGIAEPRDVKIREEDTGLSAEEWAKVPNEFRHLDQQILARFWDFAYNPVIRQTVLNYKREAALAGEVLDLPNELLAAFVDIQEATIMESAKYIAGETVEHRKASMLMKRRKMKAQAGLYSPSPWCHCSSEMGAPKHRLGTPMLTLKVQC